MADVDLSSKSEDTTNSSLKHKTNKHSLPNQFFVENQITKNSSWESEDRSEDMPPAESSIWMLKDRLQ